MYNISVLENVTLCTVKGENISDLSFILSLFSEYKINIDMISAALSQGHQKTFSFSFMDSDLEKALEIIKTLKSENYNSLPALSFGNSKIVISGDMENQSGVAYKILSKIKSYDIYMITTSVNEISILCSKADEDSILKVIGESNK